MDSMFNPRERGVVRQLDAAYVEKFETLPESNPNLVYFLGDNPSYSKTWSAVSNRIPTFRRNAGFYYSPASRRVLLPMDKLAALGWPTTSHTALAMHTARFPLLDRKRGDLVAGKLCI